MSAEGGGGGACKFDDMARADVRVGSLHATATHVVVLVSHCEVRIGC